MSNSGSAGGSLSGSEANLAGTPSRGMSRSSSAAVAATSASPMQASAAAPYALSMAAPSKDSSAASSLLHVKSKYEQDTRRFPMDPRSLLVWKDFYWIVRKTHNIKEDDAFVWDAAGQAIPAFAIYFQDPEGAYIEIATEEMLKEAARVSKPCLKLLVAPRKVPGTKKRAPSSVRAVERVSISSPRQLRVTSGASATVSSYKTIELDKAADGTVGFYVRIGNDERERDTGLFVSRLVLGTPADLSGALQPGDEITSVNGVDVTQLDMDSIGVVMRRVTRLQLVIVREAPLIAVMSPNTKSTDAELVHSGPDVEGWTSSGNISMGVSQQGPPAAKIAQAATRLQSTLRANEDADISPTVVYTNNMGAARTPTGTPARPVAGGEPLRALSTEELATSQSSSRGASTLASSTNLATSNGSIQALQEANAAALNAALSAHNASMSTSGAAPKRAAPSVPPANGVQSLPAIRITAHQPETNVALADVDEEHDDEQPATAPKTHVDLEEPAAPQPEEEVVHEIEEVEDEIEEIIEQVDETVGDEAPAAEQHPLDTERAEEVQHDQANGEPNSADAQDHPSAQSIVASPVSANVASQAQTLSSPVATPKRTPVKGSLDDSSSPRSGSRPSSQNNSRPVSMFVTRPASRPVSTIMASDSAVSLPATSGQNGSGAQTPTSLRNSTLTDSSSALPAEPVKFNFLLNW
ncbi:hypothetical protein CAOG_08417 [Capsaspora owczarzaki ATCC 30864]|uniref:PDZ domain-containing protein n=1 Tax=Capsaspora owczarzaki (strain ATCC 30864) TaxID=595528 RepID=A0A0D2WH92_CAPO3|nr:hypothetical protein CAOG_08417 [Capsaspora owczarzaki ATCC 30864]KJE88945.1 hypothetical protein CAOG_008417 [Capsaspora owczarzaki ATCC 30864]|eukprot:XP_011269988.1 hypothetical protein CAOG_08417 [Capsaspora owczarzaki ATCC 30864]